MAERATRGRWQNEPMGDERNSLPLTFALDKAQMDIVSMGVIPRVMEHKWFIFLEDGRLHFHRSWTGVEMYEIRFEFDGKRHVAREVWTCRAVGLARPSGTEDQYDVDLITRLMRGKFGIEIRPDPQPTGN
jgi:hypothetical protein